MALGELPSAYNDVPLTEAQLDIYVRQYHLPFFESWRDPEKWLMKFDGQLNPHVDKIRLPIDSDGVVDVDAYLELLFSEVFYPGTNLTPELSDPGSLLARQHLYGSAKQHDPMKYKGDTIAREFSELDENILVFPRRIRNGVRAVSAWPTLPERGVMVDRKKTAANVAIEEFGEHRRRVVETYFPHYVGQLEIFDSARPQAA